jgi:hypothetical protein
MNDGPATPLSVSGPLSNPRFITIEDKGGCFNASDISHKLLITNPFPPAVGFNLKAVKEVGEKGGRQAQTGCCARNLSEPVVRSFVLAIRGCSNQRG